MRRRLLVCAGLVGCGRVGFDPLADGRTPDALGTFGTPVLVGALASAAEDDDPTLPGDMLEIYFETTRSGGFEIHVATRPAVGAPWSAPVLEAAFASSGTEACPEISEDGLAMIFSSDRAGGKGGYDLYLSTRATRTSAWSTPGLIPDLNSPSNDYCAVIAHSGLEVIFHSERAGGPGARDLYRAVRATANALWSAPELIERLNTPGNDESALLLPGDLELMFGSEAAGKRDIYATRRPTVDEPFDAPMLVSELNSVADDSDPWLSPDGRTIFFATSRTGNSEIFEASR